MADYEAPTLEAENGAGAKHRMRLPKSSRSPRTASRQGTSKKLPSQFVSRMEFVSFFFFFHSPFFGFFFVFPFLFSFFNFFFFFFLPLLIHLWNIPDTRSVNPKVAISSYPISDVRLVTCRALSVVTARQRRFMQAPISGLSCIFSVASSNIQPSYDRQARPHTSLAVLHLN